MESQTAFDRLQDPKQYAAALRLLLTGPQSLAGGGQQAVNQYAQQGKVGKDTMSLLPVGLGMVQSVPGMNVANLVSSGQLSPNELVDQYGWDKAIKIMSEMGDDFVTSSTNIGGKMVPSSRPLHQFLLEKASNENNLDALAEIINAMPMGSMYRAPELSKFIQLLQDSL